LKAAEAPSEAIVAGSAEVLRATPQQAPLGSSAQFAIGAPPLNVPALKPAAAEVAKQYAAQSRFVGGKTFFHNENQWVDADLQKFAGAKKVRIQFGSPEYFDLLERNSQALAWASLGRNVLFVLHGTLYEVYDEKD